MKLRSSFFPIFIMLTFIMLDASFCFYLNDHHSTNEDKELNDIDVKNMIAEIIMDVIVQDFNDHENEFAHLQPFLNHLMTKLYKRFNEKHVSGQFGEEYTSLDTHKNPWYWVSRQG